MHDFLDIDRVAAALLDPQADPWACEAACGAFHATCLAQLPPLAGPPTTLATGHALGPADAANCLLDHARTACLLRALDARIASQVAQHGEARVLYAGCGPLAPLALLLTRRWRGRGVMFDLVDVHAASIDAAIHLFGLSGAADTLRSTRCADAATLRLDDEALRPSILVAEVMQRALSREPQVAVVANLLPQCEPGVVLVPHCVKVDAAIGPMAAMGPGAPSPRLLGPLLSLCADTLPPIAAAIRRGARDLPEIRLHVPTDVAAGSHLMLRTRIEAGAGEILADHDSGLTTPMFILELGHVRAGETLGFTYRLGREPGFAIRRIDE